MTTPPFYPGGRSSRLPEPFPRVASSSEPERAQSRRWFWHLCRSVRFLSLIDGMCDAACCLGFGRPLLSAPRCSYGLDPTCLQHARLHILPDPQLGVQRCTPRFLHSICRKITAHEQPKCRSFAAVRNIVHYAVARPLQAANSQYT